jgi:hypothetical protein
VDSHPDSVDRRPLSAGGDCPAGGKQRAESVFKGCGRVPAELPPPTGSVPCDFHKAPKPRRGAWLLIRLGSCRFLPADNAINTVILYVLLGITAGTLSGLIGIGGGVIIVPALVFVFGLSQHAAQGTTLALLVPPIGILGAWTYWKQGDVDIRIAAFICLGFLLGSLLGARVATQLPNLLLGRIFGGATVLIGLKMLLAR